MVQVYIKYIDDNYYLLDIDENESINLKQTVKDLNDITKIFSPFTQSFNIPATDKNKRLCGYIGNEKIQRINNNAKFDALIYISGFLSDSGKLSFDETNYTKKEQKNFKTNYASNLTGLNELLGELTIQDLFLDSDGNFDPLTKVNWNVVNMKTMLESLNSVTLANGINLKYGIPFISNNRVWTYDTLNLDTPDNIAYKFSRTPDTVNQISLQEVRTAVSYMTIMEHLLLKIGVPIECPIFNNPEVKDLFVLCNSEKLLIPQATGYPLSNWTPFVYTQAPSIGSPYVAKWDLTGGLLTGVFKVKRNTLALYQDSWGAGLKISISVNGLVNLTGAGTKIKISLRNNTTGLIIDTQEVTDGQYTFLITDIYGGASLLDINGELYFKVEVLPIDLVSWTNITLQGYQRLQKLSTVGGINVIRNFFADTQNNTSSSLLGGDKLNLITALPKMKCTDFLKSFFKTFNISVISTGLNDQSMYWVTPDNIKENNKPYSKRIVDYTPYTETDSLTKKRGNDYNQYLFSHVKSKYYDSLYGDGTYFGSLIYPLIPPTKPNKFEVTTDYSIIKQNGVFSHPTGVRTCLAFTKDTPTLIPIGAYRYKPVYEEFTLMYLKQTSLNGNKLSCELNSTQNVAINSVLESSFKNYNNGKTLAFGAENADTNSLYLNYYDDFIELLLSANTYKSEFNINLPANEIFLNFSNLNQGESNIPTGFRVQNEIIIGEQRYYLLDSSIDLTTGKGKITVLNF